MSAPLQLRVERLGDQSEDDGAADGWCVLGEPAFLSLQRLGLYPRTARQPFATGLHGVAEELMRRAEAKNALDAQLQKTLKAAQRLKEAGCYGSLTIDELSAVMLCVGPRPAAPMALLPHAQEDTWFAAMNRFLASRHPDAREPGAGTKAPISTEHLWEVFLGDVMAGLTSLRLRQSQELSHCYRLCWVPQQLWQRLESAQDDQFLCFDAVQSVANQEPWQGLEMLPQGCVPCLLEFDAHIARQAVDVHDLAAAIEGSEMPAERSAEAHELLLPPFLRGKLGQVRRAPAPAPYHMEVFHLEILGFPETETSEELLQAQPEAILAASLLLSLQRFRVEAPKPTTPMAQLMQESPGRTEPPASETTAEGEEGASPPSPPEEPDFPTPSPTPVASPPTTPPLGPILAPGEASGMEGMVSLASACFAHLAEAVEVRHLGEVHTVWKGYLECALDGTNLWKEVGKTLQMGVFGMARTAVLGSARASLRVTKRALGFASCMDRDAMDEELQRQVHLLESKLGGAVACAREEVGALGLETLSDPEAFIRFLAHDPLRALKAAPIILQVYGHVPPAQRVLLFAKLMGLAAMVGAVLRGDDRVLQAFEGPFPLNENPWLSLLDADEAQKSEPRQQAARRVVQAVQLQRLSLAKTKLLLVAGVPDAGKTTLLREVFGLRHLKAGLAEEGRTDEVLFELHPRGDLRFRPVYLVDSPGFGDGEHLHRNDMGRLLLRACDWLGSNVTLLWVLRAGRHTKDEAYRFVSGIAQSTQRLLVLVTHMDKLFEERYREAGPGWRDGILQGVPHRDPRWKQQRRGLMQELRSEVESTVRRTLQIEEGAQLPEMCFACLGGWMSRSLHDESEDEFAEPQPWPWAREELSDFFSMLSQDSLRRLLDTRLGVA